jgi:4-aminobutyrate aminotransferase-like enzyme/Ser/Thr protein kinase RdoA (MazF antagonist)
MIPTQAVDNIKFLDGDLPDFSVDAAADIARRLFGIEGELKQLHSERDQNFRIRKADGSAYVLKIANAQEDPDVLDLQHMALLHIRQQDPDWPVPELIRTVDGDVSRIVESPNGSTHIVRLISYLPGLDLNSVEATSLQLHNVGAAVARLGLALRNFFHPAANHVLLWDLKRTPEMRHNTIAIADPDRRARIEQFFDNFTDHVLPRLNGMRCQIIHNDANNRNILVDADDHDRVTGIIDYGDMVYAPLIVDLANAAADSRRQISDKVAMVCDVASGYDAVVPLEAEEIDLLYDLVVARCAQLLVILHWRAANATGNDALLHELEEPVWETFDALTTAGRAAVRQRLRDACSFPPYSPGPDEDVGEPDAVLDEIVRRRKKLLGSKFFAFYDPPIHLVRGEGVWLHGADGRTYLDAYNNVPHVGHSHPHVARAISRQYGALCTNTRYIYKQVVEYAERLAATCAEGPRVCLFVNSGSEANDIAWRMAKAYTGNSGTLVNEGAYHGCTDAVHKLSIEHVPHDQREPYIRPLLVPDSYRDDPETGNDRFVADIDQAIASLEEAGHGVAAVMIDTSFSSQGIFELPDGYLSSVVERVRAAGGVFISDEVQSGFGRMGGNHMWGCQNYGVEAEIITLGKPMANGLPMGAVITTPEILEKFNDQGWVLFSTFGGNPVACAAGMAVLDVIEREDLMAKATEIGGYMHQGLRALTEKHSVIGDVRGRGMIAGVEMVRDRDSREPVKDYAIRTMNGLRDEGVLVGRVGWYGNVLKIRPPLVFRREHADRLIDALDKVVTGL